MISFEIAQYFNTGLITIILVLSFIKWYEWQFKDAALIIEKNRTNFPVLIICCLILCVVLGFRPTGKFGDTANYAFRYALFQNEELFFSEDSAEWFFDFLMLFFAQRWDVSIFFTFIMLCYVFLALWGIFRLFKNNTTGGMLFFLGAFSFFAYATNGIRNGFACSLVILAFSFLVTKKKNWIVGVILCFLATIIHKSTTLPILCLAVSFFIKSPVYAISFWFFSIFLNLFFSTPIENFFAGMGFDDRLTSYIENAEEYAEMGNKSGFRPDFLLYSFMPIMLGWYVFLWKKIPFNRTFQLLFNTYIFSNSFWVMLMNAAFSNRFAYLSWFLYPIVIGYPCLRMNVWKERQGQMAGLILLAHSGFTFFMRIFYYGAD